ncbi:MAG: hypothetical protein WCT11_00320 [Candidatus Magasanikbacteria bacterium]
MEYKLQLHDFFIEGGNREKSHVLLHITEPSNEKERQKGYFFAVCELNNTGTKDIVKLQNIVDEIESRYYEAPQNINENSLETVLKNINRENKPTLDDQVQKHCVVGVIKDQEIVFSFCGNPKMLLFYKTKDDLYKKMDLISANQDETNDQLFSQIVEGKVTPNDFLFIGTSQLGEFFSDDRLQKIITTRPSKQSAQHIERVLSDIRNEFSFGGMVIHLNEDRPSVMAGNKRQPLPKGGSIKSLHNLFATEKNTASTMSPSMFPNINDKIKNAFQEEPSEESLEQTKNWPPSMPAEINSAHLRQYHAKPPLPQKTDVYKQILTTSLKTALIWLKYSVHFIWIVILVIARLLINLGHFLSLLFFVVTNYQNRRRNILENWSQQWRGFKSGIKNLPRTTKIFFTLSALILIVFVFSIFFIRANQVRLAQEKQSQEIIREIIAHKDAAESAAIYKDDTTTLNETQAVKNLIAQLDCKKYKKECDEFNRQIDDTLSQIRKEVVVVPDLLFDWSKQAMGLFRLAKINNQILVLPSNSSTIVIYDLLTKQSKYLDTSLTNFNDIAIPKENDYAAILSDNKTITLYDPQNSSLKTADVAYPNTDTKINDLIIYNRRLYSLDTTNNQIYKHENTKTGFGTGKEWVKDISVNIKNGLSLTTDGDMFVSKTDGTIEKLTAGNKQPFEILGLDPALKTGGQIWTYTDKQYIYLLDGTNKRLIVLQKDGHLKNQITAKEWKNPIGMIIDEQNKTAYILDSNKLYQINI